MDRKEKIENLRRHIAEMRKALKEIAESIEPLLTKRQPRGKV